MGALHKTKVYLMGVIGLVGGASWKELQALPSGWGVPCCPEGRSTQTRGWDSQPTGPGSRPRVISQLQPRQEEDSYQTSGWGSLDWGRGRAEGTLRTPCLG